MPNVLGAVSVAQCLFSFRRLMITARIARVWGKTVVCSDRGRDIL